MSSSNSCSSIFYLGTLNESAYTPPLNYNGSVRVDYTVSDYEGDAVFDVYAFNNQSKQGKGVSWTNKNYRYQEQRMEN